MSASLPGSMDPTLLSQPRSFAPPIVPAVSDAAESFHPTRPSARTPSRSCHAESRRHLSRARLERDWRTQSEVPSASPPRQPMPSRPESLENSVLREYFHRRARHQCRDQKCPALRHHFGTFVIKKRTVLDRCDTSARRDLYSSVPCACAATFRRASSASSTIAFISSYVYSVAPTASPSERTPPVAHTLITSAPYFT